MTAPDHMLEDAKWPLHETGHPHMEPPINPERFNEQVAPIPDIGAAQEPDANGQRSTPQLLRG
jgi:hypothetical protein